MVRRGLLVPSAVATKTAVAPSAGACAPGTNAAQPTAEARAVVDVGDGAWQAAERLRVVGKVVLLTHNLVLVRVDDVVSHQVLLAIVIKVIISYDLSVDVVDVVVAVVDDRLVDSDVSAIINDLLRQSGLLSG